MAPWFLYPGTESDCGRGRSRERAIRAVRSERPAGKTGLTARPHRTTRALGQSDVEWERGERLTTRSHRSETEASTTEYWDWYGRTVGIVEWKGSGTPVGTIGPGTIFYFPSRFLLFAFLFLLRFRFRI
jgi:hypothetical protein